MGGGEGGSGFETLLGDARFEAPCILNLGFRI